MRSIKTTSGAEIVLDGDLLAVLEALYHEVTARKELERSFDDMKREIDHLINQLTDDERREYLSESIFRKLWAPVMVSIVSTRLLTPASRSSGCATSQPTFA